MASRHDPHSLSTAAARDITHFSSCLSSFGQNTLFFVGLRVILGLQDSPIVGEMASSSWGSMMKHRTQRRTGFGRSQEELRPSLTKENAYLWNRIRSSFCVIGVRGDKSALLPGSPGPSGGRTFAPSSSESWRIIQTKPS